MRLPKSTRKWRRPMQSIAKRAPRRSLRSVSWRTREIVLRNLRLSLKRITTRRFQKIIFLLKIKNIMKFRLKILKFDTEAIYFSHFFIKFWNIFLEFFKLGWWRIEVYEVWGGAKRASCQRPWRADPRLKPFTKNIAKISKCHTDVTILWKLQEKFRQNWWKRSQNK